MASPGHQKSRHQREAYGRSPSELIVHWRAHALRQFANVRAILFRLGRNAITQDFVHGLIVSVEAATAIGRLVAEPFNGGDLRRAVAPQWPPHQGPIEGMSPYRSALDHQPDDPGFLPGRSDRQCETLLQSLQDQIADLSLSVFERPVIAAVV